MKPRRTSKSRHKFKFTVRVDDVIFPKAIARKLSSSKFYVLLSRADKNIQTKIGCIAEDGRLEFNGQDISIEATLFKNRNTNAYISKHFRIVLRQMKNSNHQNTNTKARESSVGSIKLDLVDYIDRIPIDEQLLFSKCALQDVFIKCCIRSQEIETAPALDDSMSVTSANTVRIDSFWLDVDDQKSASHEGNGKDFDALPISILTDKNLIQFDGKQKEMARFRIKHAMDVMANENTAYEKEHKELRCARERMEHLEQEIREKDIEIKHFHEEERKWNKTMIAWEREKTSFEASTIELNFKYQQGKQLHKECKQQLSEVTLSTKRILIEKQRIEQKYNTLVQSLGQDQNQLLVQLSHLQMEYDDLEESMIQQQNSFRQTGNIMEKDIDKQRRKTIKAVNELRKYKQRYERLKPENVELHKNIEALQKQMFRMKSEHEIAMAQAKHDTEQKLKASEHLVNELMMAQAALKHVRTQEQEPKQDDNSIHESAGGDGDAVMSASNHSSHHGKEVKAKKRRKSGHVRLRRNSVLQLEEQENSKKQRTKPKKRNRSNSVKNMIQKIEKDENMMKTIEQELLSPDEEDNEEGYRYREEGNRLTNVSDLTHISEILMKEKEDNGEEPCHRHVRSSNSVNIGTLSGIDVNDLMVTERDEGNILTSEDDVSNLSGSGLDNDNAETRVVDID